jgi:hypothetical protein
MKSLGITYRRSTPQSVGEQWWFWICEGVPAALPEYLSELNLNPLDCVGFGLSQAMADDLATPADREEYVASLNRAKTQVDEAQAAQPHATVKTFDPRDIKLSFGDVQIPGFADSEIIKVERESK